jgi:hypothetical protein
MDDACSHLALAKTTMTERLKRIRSGLRTAGNTMFWP